jgi:hypothetical protein
MTAALGRRARAAAAVVATAAALALALVPARALAQTVDDVVRRYVEARGGAARLRSVESLRFTGSMELGDVTAAFSLELQRPNKMRTEFVVNGQTGVRAYDGQRAWEQLPLPGEKPRPMADEEAAEARQQADVDLSPLVDSASKGFAVELIGRDRLPGGETWKLLVRGREGPPRTIHLDARTHLVVQTSDVRQVEGQPVEMVTEISDYRPLGGMVFPHRIELGPKGKPERQRLLIQKVELNPALDPRRFTMPAVSREPTPRQPARQPTPPTVLP